MKALPGVALFSAALQASAGFGATFSGPEGAPPLAQPCLQAGNDPQPYVKALTEAGWQVVTGPDEKVARAMVLENYRLFFMHKRVAQNPEAYDEIIAGTLIQGANAGLSWSVPAEFDQAIVLKRGPSAAVFIQAKLDGVIYTTCIFAGNALEDVAERLQSADAVALGEDPSAAQAYDMLDTPEVQGNLHWFDRPQPEGATFVPLGSKSLTIRHATRQSVGM